MPAKGWTTISLPKEMVERIKRIIEENPDLGFRSVADFVIISIQVLGGEGVNGEDAYSKVETPLQDLLQFLSTLSVTVGGAKTDLLSKPTVAVHDDGEMVGNGTLKNLPGELLLVGLMHEQPAVAA